MAEHYRSLCCRVIREIRRSGHSKKGKYRKKGHIKPMFCPGCQNHRAKFIKL